MGESNIDAVEVGEDAAAMGGEGSLQLVVILLVVEDVGREASAVRAAAASDRFGEVEEGMRGTSALRAAATSDSSRGEVVGRR